MTAKGRPTTGNLREVRIPDPTWDALGQEAALLEISRAELIRGILREWIAGQGGRSTAG